MSGLSNSEPDDLDETILRRHPINNADENIEDIIKVSKTMIVIALFSNKKHSIII